MPASKNKVLILGPIPSITVKSLSALMLKPANFAAATSSAVDFGLLAAFGLAAVLGLVAALGLAGAFAFAGFFSEVAVLAGSVATEAAGVSSNLLALAAGGVGVAAGLGGVFLSGLRRM